MKEFIRNLTFSVLLAIGGVILGLYFPVSKLYADRTGARRVDAQIVRSLFGLITIETIDLTRLQTASLEDTESGGIQLVLTCKQGDVVFGKDARLGGEREANKINEFLHDYRNASFFIWDVSWPWFVLSVFLVLAGGAIGILSFWQALQTSIF